MSPDQQAKRLGEIADQIDGARRLVTAGRMAIERTSSNSTDVDEADAVCELLYEIHDRLRASAEGLRAIKAAA